MYIVWYNTKYKRQAEAVVPKEEWDDARRKYGTPNAATILIATHHRVKNRRNATVASQRSMKAFVIGSNVRPDIYGTAVFRVGKSKKEVLHRGRAELTIVSTRGGIRVRRRKGRRRALPR